MLIHNIKKKKAFKRFYNKLLEKNSLCFDIGTNMGYKSLILLSLKHKVIGFEPQTRCHDFLLKIEKKHHNFKIQKIAIGSKNEELDLCLGNHIEIATLSNKFVTHFSNNNTFWNDKERVKVVTLNSQIETYGLPQFCKIDVEGLEYDILKNLTYKIPIIEFEFTGGFIIETLLSVSIINKLGDYTFNYFFNEKPLLKINNWVSAESISSIIKTMNTKNLHGNIIAKLNQ